MNSLLKWNQIIRCLEKWVVIYPQDIFLVRFFFPNTQETLQYLLYAEVVYLVYHPVNYKHNGLSAVTLLHPSSFDRGLDTRRNLCLCFVYILVNYITNPE